MLVIIGLVAGGVLVGNSLINSAKIRGEISQIQKIKTAVSAFKLEYDCLPGDCKDGVEWGFAASGNGNGFIEFGSGEYILAVPMLKQAGLIETVDGGTFGPLFIPSKLVNTMGYGLYGGFGARENFLMLLPIQTGFAAPPAGTSPSAKQAFQIDTKIDDGLPYAGKMQLIPYDPTYADAPSVAVLYGRSSIHTDCASSTDHTVADATYKRGDGKNCPFYADRDFN